MINIAIEQYERVKMAVKPLCKNTSRLETQTRPKLPHLLFEQLNNPIAKDRIDSENIENAVTPTVQITIYTKGDTSLVDNEAIMALADGQMISDGWIRTFGPQEVKNVVDDSVLRYIAKYEAKVDDKGTIWSR